MIQGHELRLGNLIATEGLGLPQHVIELSQNTFVTNLKANTLQHYKNAIPIPLTEEWLLKLGFNKVADKNKIANDKIVYGLFGIGFQLNLVVNHKWDVYTNWNNNKNYITANGAAVKYVHQLQNLYFALTGQELTLQQ